MKKKRFSVVAGIIINKEGKIFLAKRVEPVALEGLWEFPGGKVESNEDKRTALERELEEELNITVEVDDDAVLEWLYEYPFALIRFTAYKCKIIGGSITLNEHSDFMWINPNELESVTEIVPADIDLKKYILEKGL
jgi:8-oxo-dGTP diphosphatase